MTAQGQIRIGIGGWTYEPWRGVFYPDGLPKTRELDYATSKLTAIEINGTYYGSQKPETFEKWAAAAPDGFVYSIKASRFCTNRKKLAEGAESIDRFLGQGLTRLGDKLGPILWQFMATKQFDPDDFGAFLKLLPKERDGVCLRHALEVRHESFGDPAFVAMARDAGAAIVYTDSAKHPNFADITANFVYARLQDADQGIATGYSAKALDHWAGIARTWARGEQTEGLPTITSTPPQKTPRDVYVFMINGAKFVPRRQQWN